MTHKQLSKHVSSLHAHIQEHGHKRALLMIMASMVMMFYPYFSTRADLVQLPSGGSIEIQYSPDDSSSVNTDVIATVVVNTESGFDITNNDTSNTYTFTQNGTFRFDYDEEGMTGSIVASVDWIDKDIPTGSVTYDGDTQNGPVTAILQTSEEVTITSTGGTGHTFTQNGTFTFTFTDLAGNTGSAIAQVNSIVPTDPVPAVLTGITGIVVYTTGTTVTATVTGFNMTGVYAINNNNSLTYRFSHPGSIPFILQTAGGNTGTITATATSDMFVPTDPVPAVLTGITGIVVYTTGTTVTATVTGLNMTGVSASNNNSLTYTFTSPGTFIFSLQTSGGNTGTVTVTATSGMFTTGSTPPPIVNTGVVCDTGDIVLTGALGGIYSATTPVVVGGLFSINWTTANNDCNPDQIVTIQLRDHNGQWITLGTGELDGTGVLFASTGLAQTGLYTIVGVHASGTIYTYTGTSGQQLTGTYTADTPYTIYTGAYTGAYTGLWTGYQVRILSASGINILSGAQVFTIDNIAPTLTGSSFLITGANGSGVVGSGGTFTLSFITSELLQDIQLSINNTVAIAWSGTESTGYSLTGGFGATNLSGPINYTVSFTDKAGNTGSWTGIHIYTVDTIDPNFQGFTATGTAASGVRFSWNTSKSTVYNLKFSMSGSTGTVTPLITTLYGTSHTYTTPALANSKTYIFSITINDTLQNTNFMSGTVVVNASGAASITIATQDNNVLQLSSQVEAKLFSEILKEEIKKFESCKADIDFKSTTIQLNGNKSINLKIPEMEKNTTKTIVQAFSLMLINKLKAANLSTAELDETQTKVNNFFVILKLLKDDNGGCKQNMSAYYIGQFERIMEEMLQ